MGRVGVDLYPEQIGVAPRGRHDLPQVPRRQPDQRRGRRGPARTVAAAVITRTGADPFGEYIHRALRGFGVDDRFVSAVARPAARRSRSARSSRPTTSRCTSTGSRRRRTSRSGPTSSTSTRSRRPTSSGSPAPACARSRRARPRWRRSRRAAVARPHRARPRLPADVLGVRRGGAPARPRRGRATPTSRSATARSARSPSASASRRRPRAALLDGRRRPRHRQAGPGRRARRPRRRVGRRAAGPGRGRQRARRGRRLRRRAVPRAAGRLGPRADPAVRQRGRRHRRRPAGLRRRDADHGRAGRDPREGVMSVDARRPGRRSGPTDPGWWPRWRRPACGPTSLVGSTGRLMLVAADHTARGACAPAPTRSRWPTGSGCCERLVGRAVAAGRRRRPRHRRHPRGPPAAGRARGQGRHRLDEPRRPGRHGRSRSTTASPATTPTRSRRMGFQGGKMLLRIDPDDPATAPTARGLRRGRRRPRRRTA